METKMCTKCVKFKLLSDFHKNKTRKNKLGSWCNECKRLNAQKNKRLNNEGAINHINNYIGKKRCTICKEIKILEQFGINKVKKGEVNNSCKKCTKIYYRNYYKNHVKKPCKKRPKQSKEEIALKRKEWYIKNYNKISEKKKEYYKKNANKLKELRKNNKEKRKIYIRKYEREKLRNNPIYRLSHNIRFAVWHSLKGNKNGHRWENLLGYTCGDLRQHLEAQFEEGMTWDNYGKNGWVLDHKIPVSLFNITGIKSKGFKKCWELENLRPMWENENFKKSSTLFV